jgi:hypothetical protein
VDFPRLSKLIAEDEFLPNWFALVGRRLVYTTGILFLATAAGLLLVLFGGITDRLIPLFAVGAFGAFTLSQAGMFVHWRTEIRRQRTSTANPDPGSSNLSKLYLRLVLNGVGAVATGLALAILLSAKFSEGAWITVLVVPMLLTTFILVHRHYAKVQNQVCAAGPLDLENNQPPIVLVPTRRWDKLTGKALRFSMWLTTDVIAVHLSNLSGEQGQEECERIRREWSQNVEAPAHAHGVPVPRLIVKQSPFRSFLAPLLEEIDHYKASHPDRLIGVVIPELVETRWWQVLLHRRRPARLRTTLLKRGDHRVVVIDVPWYIDE